MDFLERKGVESACQDEGVTKTDVATYLDKSEWETG